MPDVSIGSIPNSRLITRELPLLAPSRQPALISNGRYFRFELQRRRGVVFTSPAESWQQGREWSRFSARTNKVFGAGERSALGRAFYSLGGGNEGTEAVRRVAAAGR
jgi:hypothetical protein